MIYIVSGYMRSGTSMMMQALEAGGMEAGYRSERDDQINANFGRDDYVPNERYFELGIENFQRLDFPECYDGKVIKCLFGGVMLFPVYPVRIIFMRRNTESIKSSILAMRGRILNTVRSPYFQKRLDQAVACLRDRRSVISLTEINFEDVVSNPFSVFGRLQFEGWPIDPEAASRIPRPEKVRSAA